MEMSCIILETTMPCLQYDFHLVDTLRAKKQLFFLPPSQNLLRAGHVPIGSWMHIFQARAMAAAPSRAPSQLARRDALSLTVSVRGGAVGHKSALTPFPP